MVSAQMEERGMFLFSRDEALREEAALLSECCEIKSFARARSC